MRLKTVNNYSLEKGASKLDKINGCDLIDSLHRLLELNQQLKRTAEMKKSILIDGDVGKLEVIIAAEMELLKQIAEEEGIRVKTVAAISAAVHGQNAEPLGFDEILPFLSDEQGQQLLSMKNELVLIINELREVNKTNEDLTKVSLNYVEYMINTIVETGEEDQTYSPGEPKQANQSHLLDWKA